MSEATDTEFDVGVRLREIRQQYGLSQRQLADRAGVPHGQISMIETSKSSPSVASLRKILGGFGMNMSEFFEPDVIEQTQVFFKPDDLRDLTSQLYQGQEAIRTRMTLKQVGDAKAHGLQILHERYEAGADTGEDLIEHEASEGGIVISGELEVTVGTESRVLKAGDAYLFNSRQPHRFRNISDRAAEVISACTPPYL
ncbi:cupin domain-containing protein [Sulfitobacter sp. M57]|uniref:cupin domain-containing protein n=1 Tax=unclassified Sulfitobacter TaxID=196795 RepID=UPI0023E0FA1E|nr:MULTISPECIES: cupin domain-containing protein [unclassified Sulfitobacter]MDF3416086.1 cupin domain-containing protein [Sulfitobacter sp. KE5]MDF3423565.1 cupin domain-containing protein [Sulfitobacter sp. KE43]MDF3434633.1 cupin domain-containing protein [Sulfitobacter sp. KE42]MDF3460271.1 cupin domain-containing protein [Sulfitobacter sp. S74]MDF3464171.1 cupin domain-containing protein [Sulfitobacter sp. Ks18]